MSTILDSLKKSADQREDGQQGSIDNFNFGKTKSSKKTSSGLFIAIIFILLLLAILYWGYTTFLADQETHKVAMNTEPAAANIDNIKPQNGNADKKLAASETIKTTNDKQDKPDSQSVKQKIKEINLQKQQERKEQSLASSNKQPANPTNNNTTQLTTTSASKTEQEPLITLTPPPKHTEQKQEPPKTKVQRQKYTYIYQLPFTLRKDIPKLTLNIHVFDKNPENRIAIINGEKFAIDDMIAELVLVKDIVQEGVLLEFNNQEFLVPKL